MVREISLRGRRGWVPVLAVIAVLCLAGVAAAAASVRFDGKPGRKAPPARLLGRRMHKFGRDHRKLGHEVSTVRGPTGSIAFSEQVIHLRVKNTSKAGHWRTWSHHYRGDVYWLAPPGGTIYLPAGTTAFYFYAEPNDPGVFRVTASTAGASSGALRVRGKGGARFFGFVAKGGATLSSITVTSTDDASAGGPGGFAIGEFGIHK